MGDLLNDRVFWIAIATGATVGAVLFAIVLPLIRHHPAFRPLKGTDPAPRDRSIKGYRRLALSEWQSGVLGPRDKDPEVLPYLAHHILDLNSDRVLIRAGGAAHAGRFLLFVMVLAPLFAVAFGLQLIKMLGFFERGGGYCITYDLVAGETEVISTPVVTNLFGFFQEQYCRAALVFDPNSSIYTTWASKFIAFLNPDELSLILLFLLPLIGILIAMRPMPAPLVFDRKRRMVYTFDRGSLWAAPWDDLQMIAAGGPFTTMPAFALRRDGTGPERWFALAGYHARGEIRNNMLGALGLDWINRWDGMRCWLGVFMEQGPQNLHGRFVGRGLGDIIAPRRRRLPEDLNARVDKLNLPAGKKINGMPLAMTALMSQRENEIMPEECGLRLAP